MAELTMQQKGGLAAKKALTKKLGSKKAVREYYQKLQAKGVRARKRNKKNGIKKLAK